MEATLKVDLTNEQVLELLADVSGSFTDEDVERAHSIIGADPKYIIRATDPNDWSDKEKFELLKKLFGYRSLTDKGQIIANVSDVVYCQS